MQPIYLNVPYERKSEAKELGAKFDWDKRLWYANEGNIDELQRKFKIYEPLEKKMIESEDLGEFLREFYKKPPRPKRISRKL